MAAFEILTLSAELILIRWLQMPDESDAIAYIRQLEDVIENAAGKVYFVSDLRRGHVENVHVIRRIGKLAGHANWGGGPALVESGRAQVYVGLFQRFSHTDTIDYIFQSIPDVLAELERLKPGITVGHDWDTLLA